MYTLICEDNIEGVFSGIYAIWAQRYDRHQVRLSVETSWNYELFMEYRRIETDLEAARKVANRIRRQFGEQAYEEICYALWSSDEKKANLVYEMIRDGIEGHKGVKWRECLTYPSVQGVFQLQRSVYNEAHHYLGFIRFHEKKSGILCARIRPKHYILEFLAMHFSDRMPSERWVIQDMIRGRSVVHFPQKGWFLVESELIEEILSEEESLSEQMYRQLWTDFCDTISIESRENIALQRQNFPLRFRE